jgi:IMP dehydrogenase
MTNYYRSKVHYKEIVATFDDILIQPGFTNFDPNEVDISTHLGPHKFNVPIISAAMDTVTEEVFCIVIAPMRDN